MIDLREMETYPNGVVPDEDVVTALRVIRTLREVCLDYGAPSFDADGAVLLARAHEFIVDACRQIDPANVVTAADDISIDASTDSVGEPTYVASTSGATIALIDRSRNWADMCSALEARIAEHPKLSDEQIETMFVGLAAFFYKHFGSSSAANVGEHRDGDVHERVKDLGRITARNYLRSVRSSRGVR